MSTIEYLLHDIFLKQKGSSSLPSFSHGFFVCLGWVTNKLRCAILVCEKLQLESTKSSFQVLERKSNAILTDRKIFDNFVTTIFFKLSILVLVVK